MSIAHEQWETQKLGCGSVLRSRERSVRGLRLRRVLGWGCVGSGPADRCCMERSWRKSLESAGAEVHVRAGPGRSHEDARGDQASRKNLRNSARVSCSHKVYDAVLTLPGPGWSILGRRVRCDIPWNVWRVHVRASWVLMDWQIHGSLAWTRPTML